MEILFEFLFQIILEGSIELGSEKTVPKPLRILAAFIVFTVFFGMGESLFIRDITQPWRTTEVPQLCCS